MKISVAMATYNGAQYIEEQLESIRIQTMPVDEVRICDDGSSDDTVEVICHYIREHGLESSWSVDVNVGIEVEVQLVGDEVLVGGDLA